MAAMMQSMNDSEPAGPMHPDSAGRADPLDDLPFLIGHRLHR